MNALDRLLADDLHALLDRVAAGRAHIPREEALRDRLDEAEHRLAALRLGLLARYEEWRSALAECEDLWSLAALRGADLPQAEERRAA